MNKTSPKRKTKFVGLQVKWTVGNRKMTSPLILQREWLFNTSFYFIFIMLEKTGIAFTSLVKNDLLCDGSAHILGLHFKCK